MKMTTIANHSDLLTLDLQFFNEEPVEPIEPSADSTEEPIEPQEPTEPIEQDSPPQEEFDLIKYNKEEVQIPASKRQEYLQKGYYYEQKAQAELEALKQQTSYLDKIAQLTGYQTQDELFQAIQEMEEQQRIQQESQKLGMDPDSYRQYIAPVNQKMQEMENQLKEFQRKETQRQVEAEVNDLRSRYDDFDAHEEDVFNLAINKGYSLEDAYKIITYELKLNQVAQQKEQEVLAKVTGRDQKQVLSSNDQPHNAQFDPASMSLAEIEALSQRVKQGERITF
jgi:hypothetical protein